MRKSILIAVLMVAGLFGVFSLAQQRSVTVMILWSGTELEAFEAALAPFEQRTGIDVVVESVGRDLPAVLVARVGAGNPPDVAAMPNPGQMKEFAELGRLVALDFLDLSDHPKAFVELGSVGGTVYGVFISADLKSLVWYSPKEFATRGYKVPRTWEQMLALSEQIVGDGGTPWCIGLESGAASGWPGTDWIEDIMLRTAGPEVYDKWVAHDIPWTDIDVAVAWEMFGEIARNEDYVYGRTTGALAINFGDSPNPMFTDPPGCYMHRQATFIQSFILTANPDLVPGEDYDIFVFPPIEEGPAPLLGAGDLISAFNDTPEVRELMEYLASAEAQEIWVGALGKLAINVNVDPAVYPDPVTANAAEILAGAEVFRFDGSDLMPAAIGAGVFWTGVCDYIGGVPLETVLEAIEEAADASYTSGLATGVLKGDCYVKVRVAGFTVRADNEWGDDEYYFWVSVNRVALRFPGAGFYIVPGGAALPFPIPVRRGGWAYWDGIKGRTFSIRLDAKAIEDDTFVDDVANNWMIVRPTCPHSGTITLTRMLPVVSPSGDVNVDVHFEIEVTDP